VSDVHYASDVLLGATIGTLVGYGVPLLHYRLGNPSTTRQGAAQPPGLQMTLVPSPNGIGVAGTF
jgi:membrane-associated phospholipid phosphatase